LDDEKETEMRRPTLLVLLSAALILACWASPSLAQTAPAGAAKAPTAASQAKPLAAPGSATTPDGYALARVLSGASTCAAATSPLPDPAIFCPHCPPGYVYCQPFCRCCKGGQ
jgi:hypothetical protein